MKEKVIQFGEGNFLRGFVDYFLDSLNKKGLFDGRVVVVQPIENGLVCVLNEQNGKYNLFLRGIEQGKIIEEHSEIDVISRGVNPYVSFDEYLALAKNPDMRFIVSNTTEAGIAYVDGDQFTDAPPSSFPAKLTRLLFERFKEGLPGFIILACELIDKNGDELKKCLLKYADKWQLGEGFVDWVNTGNTFSNTLVDRIVTGYPHDEADELSAKLGYTDQLLDTAEIFHLWVIEGNFEDELPFQEAGFNIVWTDDVTPFKRRKVRILNGGHTSMVLAAILAGLETVGDCMNDETVCAYLRKCLFDEIIPVLGGQKDDIIFANAVLERFSNPFIQHRLRSISLNSVSKFAVRVLPTILEYKQQNGGYPKALTFSLSALIAFYKNDTPDDDRDIVAFMKAATPAEILSNEKLWGRDLSNLLAQVNDGLERIQKNGIREAIRWTL